MRGNTQQLEILRQNAERELNEGRVMVDTLTVGLLN